MVPVAINNGKKVAKATFFSPGEFMRFYTISDSYINYLKKLDATVPNNYSGKRPYIGVILEINEHKYLAPLTSYKQKQDKIHGSSLGAFKLHERSNENNKLGMICLNNMIPVLESEITELDIDIQEEKYKRMLYLQYEFIKTKKEEIIIKAKRLHDAVTVKKEKFYSGISCNFQLLEQSYTKYNT